MQPQEQTYYPIVKLLDREDRRKLFELLFKHVGYSKKEAAKKLGAKDSEIYRYISGKSTPQGKRAARMFAYLLNEVAAPMDNSENEQYLPGYHAYEERSRVLAALKDYRSKCKAYDADFQNAWSKIINKLWSEESTIHRLVWMNLHVYLRSENNWLQESVSKIEKSEARTDKVRKLCEEKAIPQPNDSTFQVISEFPEGVWLELLEFGKRFHWRLSLAQIKQYGEFLVRQVRCYR